MNLQRGYIEVKLIEGFHLAIRNDCAAHGPFLKPATFLSFADFCMNTVEFKSS